MSVKVVYQTSADAAGGGGGHCATLDLEDTFEVNLTRPKELGGGAGDGANREKLFAAGDVACLLGVMNLAP